MNPPEAFAKAAKIFPYFARLPQLKLSLYSRRLFSRDANRVGSPSSSRRRFFSSIVKAVSVVKTTSFHREIDVLCADEWQGAVTLNPEYRRIRQKIPANPA
jgi:hypothetical protein